MHRDDAFLKKLWPISLEYLFCVATALLLYITVLTSDRAGLDDKGQNKKYLTLAALVTHTTQLAHKERIRESTQTARRKK